MRRIKGASWSFLRFVCRKCPKVTYSAPTMIWRNLILDKSAICSSIWIVHKRGFLFDPCLESTFKVTFSAPEMISRKLLLDKSKTCSSVWIVHTRAKPDMEPGIWLVVLYQPSLVNQGMHKRRSQLLAFYLDSWLVFRPRKAVDCPIFDIHHSSFASYPWHGQPLG